MEPFFGSVDKGIVDIDFFPDSGQNESDDDDEQEDIGEGGGVSVYLCTSSGSEKIDDTADEQAGWFRPKTTGWSG